MKYIDSGSRDTAQTLAYWLEGVLNEDIIELRLQAGFFSLNAIGLLIPTLEQCKLHNHPTNVLIGSNDASTLKDDVIGLVDALGIPRNHAQLGIVSFSGALFHPKTYHVKRCDGSQAAFVGSANLTASGLALHVEAGIALDTRDGDSPQHLSHIATAIDSWFTEQRAGMTVITGPQTVDDLVADGTLSLVRPPRSTSQNQGSAHAGSPAPPRLQPLFTLPPAPPQTGQLAPQVAATPVTSPTPPAPVVTSLPSAPRNSFPPYLLFQPNAIGPTVGASALTGSLLSGGAVGLIVQLNKDSARHFMGGTGTANISIPVATVSTLRFGISGIHNRPTGHFHLHIRFSGDNFAIHGRTSTISVMGYGFTPAETGHGDIRMLVPAATRDLGTDIQTAGKIKPTVGDLAFLEWPTVQDPTFRLTFLDKQSALYQQATNAFATASATGQLVGNGACWLAAGISPNW